MRNVRVGALLLTLLAWPLAYATAAGSAWTYQGRLTSASGVPISGAHSLSFRLWDSVAGGSQIGPDVSFPQHVVVNGLVTVSLDFGPDIYTGAALWLEPIVDGEALSRQEVRPVPFALYAAGPWVDSGAGLSYSAGNVGIGTSQPQAALDVRGDVKLGAAGEFDAPGGLYPLKIYQGYVDYFGNTASGHGFTATNPATGAYELTFTPPFSGTPSVCLTALGGSSILYLDSLNALGCTVIVVSRSTGAMVNSGFSITATGPR